MLTEDELVSVCVSIRHAAPRRKHDDFTAYTKDSVLNRVKGYQEFRQVVERLSRWRSYTELEWFQKEWQERERMLEGFRNAPSYPHPFPDSPDKKE